MAHHKSDRKLCVIPTADRNNSIPAKCYAGHLAKVFEDTVYPVQNNINNETKLFQLILSKRTILQNKKIQNISTGKLIHLDFFPYITGCTKII